MAGGAVAVQRLPVHAVLLVGAAQVAAGGRAGLGLGVGWWGWVGVEGAQRAGRTRCSQWHMRTCTKNAPVVGEGAHGAVLVLGAHRAPAVAHAVTLLDAATHRAIHAVVPAVVPAGVHAAAGGGRRAAGAGGQRTGLHGSPSDRCLMSSGAIREKGGGAWQGSSGWAAAAAVAGTSPLGEQRRAPAAWRLASARFLATQLQARCGRGGSRRDQDHYNSANTPVRRLQHALAPSSQRKQGGEQAARAERSAPCAAEQHQGQEEQGGLHGCYRVPTGRVTGPRIARDGGRGFMYSGGRHGAPSGERPSTVRTAGKAPDSREHRSCNESWRQKGQAGCNQGPQAPSCRPLWRRRCLRRRTQLPWHVEPSSSTHCAAACQ